MDISNASRSSVYNFATEQARAIVHLHFIDLAVCALIALTVIGLVSAAAIRFRARPGDAEPEQSEGNVKLEIVWTAVPALILLVIGILTAAVMHSVSPPAGDRKPDVIVNAHQFWWEYRYPKSGVVTANELYLPYGVNSLIEVRSADVVHSFWVPDFGQKMDACPGHPNTLFLKPIAKGVFIGSCSEYCGAGHSLMRIIAHVVAPAEFDLWTKSQLLVPPRPGEAQAQRGAELFMSKTCSECHSIAGTGAKATVGPDLTHLAERETLGAGVVANDLANLTAWIQDPQQFKPGCHMPKMRLSKDESHAIAVYLESLK